MAGDRDIQKLIDEVFYNKILTVGRISKDTSRIKHIFRRTEHRLLEQYLVQQEKFPATHKEATAAAAREVPTKEKPTVWLTLTLTPGQHILSVLTECTWGLDPF